MPVLTSEEDERTSILTREGGAPRGEDRARNPRGPKARALHRICKATALTASRSTVSRRALRVRVREKGRTQPTEELCHCQ